jgi:hypothetical protein
VIQQPDRVGAHVRAVDGGAAGQGVQIAHRVDGDLAGQIGRVSASLPWLRPGTDLDQLSTTDLSPMIGVTDGSGVPYRLLQRGLSLPGAGASTYTASCVPHGFLVHIRGTLVFHEYGP